MRVCRVIIVITSRDLVLFAVSFVNAVVFVFFKLLFYFTMHFVLLLKTDFILPVFGFSTLYVRMDVLSVLNLSPAIPRFSYQDLLGTHPNAWQPYKKIGWLKISECVCEVACNLQMLTTKGIT